MSFTKVPFGITTVPLPITPDGTVLFRDSTGAFHTLNIAGGGIYQPLNSNLTAISGITMPAYGLGLLSMPDSATARAYLGIVPTPPTPPGSGTVTSFSFTNLNGISGTVTNPTTNPNLTLSLGAITPISITTGVGSFSDIYATGQVGIGNSSPSYSLDITKSAASLRVFDTRVGGAAFIIGSSFSLGDTDLTSTGSIFVTANSTLLGYFNATGLNNMAIGAFSPSTGAFTTLNATGSATFQNDVNLNRSAGTNYLYYSSDLAIAKNGVGNALAFDTSRNATFTGSITANDNITINKTAGRLAIFSATGRPNVVISTFGTAAGNTDTPLFELNRSTIAMPSGGVVGELRYDGLNTASTYTVYGMIQVITTGVATATGSPSRMDFLVADGTTAQTAFQILPTGVKVAGRAGIGADAISYSTIRLGGNITGATQAYAVYVDGEVQSDVTSSYHCFHTIAATHAASFTVSNIRHFIASQGTFGAGSAVTNQTGFDADSTLVGATNNYGFRGRISSGAGRWNLYLDGTAANYIKGNLQVDGTISGAGITANFASPPPIGSTTPNTGAFTTISASGQITSTVTTGTAPFVVSSTTAVTNLNASLLLGSTWASPGTIGSTTPNTGSFTTLTATAIENTPIGSATPSTGKFTSLIFTSTLTIPAGTALAPSIRFSGDTTTGIYQASTGRIDFSASGTSSFSVQAGGVSVTGTANATSLRGSDGSVATPSLSFFNDVDTGFYRIGSGNIGVTLNGTFLASFSPSGFGIGVTATRPLHVKDTGATNESVLIENTGDVAGYTQILLRGTGRTWQMGVGNASEVGLGVANKWYLYDAGSSTMRMIMATTGVLSVPGGISANLTGNVTGNVTGNLTGNVTGNVSGSSGSCTGNAATATTAAACTGNAATATALQTARTINGTSFNGTANISISATANGSGAVARTINNRASDVFNVKDYGAVGDGSTPDHAAIQAAADALTTRGYGTLYFPDGRYACSGQITVGNGSNAAANYSIRGEGLHSSVIIQTSNNASSPTLYVNVDNASGAASARCEVYELGFRTASGVSSNAAITVNVASATSSEFVGPISIHDIDIGFDPAWTGSGGWVYGVRVLNPWKVVLRNISGSGAAVGTIPAVGGSCGDGTNGAGSGALLEIVGGINVLMTDIYGSFFQQGLRQRAQTIGSLIGAQGFNITNFQTVAVIESAHFYAGVAISALNVTNFLFDQGNSVNNGLANYGIIVDCTDGTYPNIRGQVGIFNGNVTMAAGSTGAVFKFMNVSQAVVSGVVDYTANGLFAYLTNSCNKIQLMNNEMGGAAITVDAGCSYVYVNNTQSAGTLTGFGGTVVNLATPF